MREHTARKKRNGRKAQRKENTASGHFPESQRSKRPPQAVRPGPRTLAGQRSPSLSRKRSVAAANKFSFFITTSLKAAVVATTYILPGGRTTAPGARFALQKINHNLTNAPSGAGGLLSPPPPRRRSRAREGRELTRRCQVPVAGTPGGEAAALKGLAVKVTGGLWGRAEWAPGGKQTLNFQLGLDLPGGVWPVCKGAAEAFNAFGWVSKGGWDSGEAQGS